MLIIAFIVIKCLQMYYLKNYVKKYTSNKIRYKSN